MLATEKSMLMTAKNKRFDPNYNKITADVEREVSMKVRAICALTDTSFSDAVNEGLKLWIELKKKDEKFEI